MYNHLFSVLFFIYSDSLRIYDLTKDKDDFTKRSFFVELLGQGITISANYDYRFNYNLTYRVGIGILPVLFIFVPSFPMSINFLSEILDSHYLELGVGTTFFFIFPLPTANIGYRYQPKRAGFMLRINFTPIYDIFYFKDGLSQYLFGPNGKSQLVLLGGISFGYTR
ncbi:MAG: hypothetical protein ABDH37_05910 [Candidatus Hydrothermales bacterium]